MSKKQIKIFKIILGLLIIALILSLTIYLVPTMKNLATLEGQTFFKESVSKAGIAGILILFLYEATQMFLAFLPGEPIEFLAGMCYGWLGGMIFLLVSIFLISSLIFYLSKKFGKKFICLFFDEENVNKIEKDILLKGPQKVERIMFLLFLIPGTPKDILVYIAGIMPVKPVKFLLISTIARFPSIITSTLAGDSLAVGNWQLCLIIYAFTFLLIIITMLLLKIFDKNKEIRKTIDTLK